MYNIHNSTNQLTAWGSVIWIDSKSSWGCFEREARWEILFVILRLKREKNSAPSWLTASIGDFRLRRHIHACKFWNTLRKSLTWRQRRLHRGYKTEGTNITSCLHELFSISISPCSALAIFWTHTPVLCYVSIRCAQFSWSVETFPRLLRKANPFSMQWDAPMLRRFRDYPTPQTPSWSSAQGNYSWDIIFILNSILYKVTILSFCTLYPSRSTQDYSLSWDRSFVQEEHDSCMIIWNGTWIGTFMVFALKQILSILNRARGGRGNWLPLQLLSANELIMCMGL